MNRLIIRSLNHPLYYWNFKFLNYWIIWSLNNLRYWIIDVLNYCILELLNYSLELWKQMPWKHRTNPKKVTLKKTWLSWLIVFLTLLFWQLNFASEVYPYLFFYFSLSLISFKPFWVRGFLLDFENLNFELS